MATWTDLCSISNLYKARLDRAFDILVEIETLIENYAHVSSRLLWVVISRPRWVVALQIYQHSVVRNQK